jgi:hypothetical protein
MAMKAGAVGSSSLPSRIARDQATDTQSEQHQTEQADPRPA